jgi:hypothetical protein
MKVGALYYEQHNHPLTATRLPVFTHTRCFSSATGKIGVVVSAKSHDILEQFCYKHS